MTKEGVITLEPQNGAEAVALRHWEQVNRVSVPGGAENLKDGYVLGRAIQIVGAE